MEIRLQLRPQTIIDMYTYLERLELETMVLLLMIPFMLPFLLSSMWSLGLTVLWEAFGLGVKAGMTLFFIGSMYLTILKVTNWRTAFGLRALCDVQHGDEDDGKVHCTLMDVVLSVMFQTGLNFPSIIWNPMMELLAGENRLMDRYRRMSGRGIASRFTPPISPKPPSPLPDVGGGSNGVADVGGAGDYESIEEDRQMPQKTAGPSSSDNNSEAFSADDTDTADIVEELVRSKVGRSTRAGTGRRRAAKRNKL